MRYLIFLFACLFIASSLRAQQGDRREIDHSTPPPGWDIPEAPILGPEEALKSIRVQPGFRVELVAAEPLLHDPIAMDFDEDGRIWVVEMRSYMPNVDGEGEIAPVSRVVVLEDTNGDGQMDQSTVWMDELTLPRAIRVVAGGALIGEPPHLWFTRDTTGDGRADEKIMVADDYSHREANPEHGSNGLLIGLDNWIHDAMSDSGRFRMIDGEWIRAPSLRRGQWGISMDDYGRHFTNSNSDYLRADFVPNHYYARNPNFPARGGVIPGSMGGVYEQVDSDQRVWPSRITPGVNRRNQLDDEGFLTRYTAACAPLVYRGDQFPPEYRGNVFVAEPAAHFIRRAVLEENEYGIISGNNAYQEDEFLTSSDERFRPVNLYNGPDGALYIVDMYRGILQHRQFVTTYLRQQILERGLEEPLGLGRIYRVVHESSERVSPPPLSSKSSVELVALLEHENGWHRDTAQRLLVERGDEAAVPLLNRMALESENELARIHALWTLEGLGRVTPPLAMAASRDESPRVRSAAIRVSEPYLAASPDMRHRVIALTADPSPIVRLQAAFSLGEAGGAEVETAFQLMLERHPDQPFLAEAILSGLHGRELPFMRRLVHANNLPEDAAMPAALAGAVMRSGETDAIRELFALALDAPSTWLTLAILRGIDQSRVANVDTRRPESLALLTAAETDSVRQAAEDLAAKLNWAGEETVDVAALGDAEQELFDKGRRFYQMNCAACHQAEGRGMVGIAASLVDSDWVVGDEGNLIRIVLQGKEGDAMLMPPMGAGLTDEEVAAILTYMRRSWGHTADPVSPGSVAEIRGAHAERAVPWTEDELNEHAAGQN